jgi:Ca-activated chloride channel family protein
MNFVLKQSKRFQVLILCVVTSLVSSSPGQSLDEVHIPTRNDANNRASTGSLGSVNGLPTPDAHTKPLHVDVDLVLVPVAVTDASNRPVIALQKQDFALYEENRTQEIRYFSVEEAPISIALLIDTSESMTEKIDTERAAIVEFFNNANPADEYFAITFSKRPQILAGPTQSMDDIERRLIAVEPGGSTAMLDAIYLAESKLRSARYQRRAIFIISDGGDNASRYTLREIKSLVRESDVQIFAVGLFDTFFKTIEERLGRMWLSEITDPTGGRTISVDNRARLPEAAAELSREMRNEYVLGYRPNTAGTNKWRKLKVRVTSTAGEQPLQAHYKKGYQAFQSAGPGSSP